MGENEDTTRELLGRAACGDARATEQLLELHRERLLQMVAFRMDRRLSRRIDASDVVQDALIEAARTARIRRAPADTVLPVASRTGLQPTDRPASPAHPRATAKRRSRSLLVDGAFRPLAELSGETVYRDGNESQPELDA